MLFALLSDSFDVLLEDMGIKLGLIYIDALII